MNVPRTSSSRGTHRVSCDTRGQRSQIDGPDSITAQLVALGMAEPAVLVPTAELEPGGVIELSNGSGSRTRQRYPVLQAVPSENGRTLLAWCPWCRRRHTHGRHGACKPGSCGCGLHLDLHGFRGPCTCAPGAGDGHRGAHCWPPDSPFKATGYIVKEIRP